MSIQSDALEMQRQRQREAALRQRLDQLEAAKEKSTENGNAQCSPTEPVEQQEPLVPCPVPVSSSTPVRVIGERQEKPWIRNGKQYRPMTRKEASEEDADRIGRQAVAQYNRYCGLVQADLDEGEAEKRAVEARARKEQRTGLIHFKTNRRDERCSLVEAARRGLIGGGSGSDGQERDENGRIYTWI